MNFYRFIKQNSSNFSWDTIIFSGTILCGSIVVCDAYIEGIIAQRPSKQLTTENTFALQHLKEQPLYSAQLNGNSSSSHIRSSSLGLPNFHSLSSRPSKKEYQLNELENTPRGQKQKTTGFYFHQKRIMERLASNGYLVIDNIFSKQHIHKLAEEIRDLQKKSPERFYAPNNNDSIRNDLITFLDNEDRQHRGLIREENEQKCDKERGSIMMRDAQYVIRGIGNIINDSKHFNGFKYNENNWRVKEISKNKISIEKAQNVDTVSTGGNVNIDSSKVRASYQMDQDYMDSESLSSPVSGNRKWIGVPDKMQLSVYSADGQFYVPHRDGEASSRFPWYGEGLLNYLRSRSYRKRYLTAILYCNDGEEWDSKRDGGCLTLFLGTHLHDDSGETATRTVDIAPKGGRLVLFDSNTMLHEVQPSYRERLALSIFFTINE